LQSPRRRCWDTVPGVRRSLQSPRRLPTPLPSLLASWRRTPRTSRRTPRPRGQHLLALGMPTRKGTDMALTQWNPSTQISRGNIKVGIAAAVTDIEAPTLAELDTGIGLDCSIQTMNGTSSTDTQ